MQKVLIIEDEQAIRSIVTEVLEEEDFQVICAEDGRQGVELAQTEYPDLILCDVMMPELDGFEVLAQIRKNLSTAAIPFVFLTARANKLDMRRGMLLGADDYLTKPFTVDELLGAIRARLARHTLLAKAYTDRVGDLSPDWVARKERLRQAIDHSEFVLYYQPQVCLKTEQIVGVEALVRWYCPETGIVLPSQFIPLAEESGLIIPLGDWVLHTACTQAKQWQIGGLPPLKMAVNLSSLQFHQEDLIQRIKQALDQTGLAPHFLDLELTESLLVKNVDATIAKLQQLKSLGVQIAVDDFGTGYTSLGYLQHFPFDVLKIDRSFVQDVHHNAKNAAITTALVHMAHDLDLIVVAEGVEVEAEKDVLVKHQCDRIQGYLYSRPIPASDFEKLFIANLAATNASSFEMPDPSR